MHRLPTNNGEPVIGGTTGIMMSTATILETRQATVAKNREIHLATKSNHLTARTTGNTLLSTSALLSGIWSHWLLESPKLRRVHSGSIRMMFGLWYLKVSLQIRGIPRPVY